MTDTKVIPALGANEKPLASSAVAGTPFTLRDVAEVTGVSISAVSKVLNNRDGVSSKTRQKVLQAVAEYGYTLKPTSAPLSAISHVRLLTLDQYAGNNAYYGEIIDAILEQLSRERIVADINLVPSAAIHRGEVIPLPWKEPPASAILIGVDHVELLDKLYEGGTNTVLVNGMDRRMRMSSVSPDYHFGGWLATRHLLELGHRNIVHITHSYRESVVRRLDGFRDALEYSGIAYAREKHLLDLGSPNFFSIEAREVVSRYLSATKELPTAFFCVSDIVAIGTIQAIREHGLSVPGDISVVGFDGLSIGAHSSPSLTTMKIDRTKLGTTAVQLLEEQASSGSQPVKRVGMGVSLVERDSSGPPRV